MPRNAIILGMARSGTSLTASVFVRHGYFSGDDFRPADHLNPRGYWESESLVQRNSKLLMDTGFTRDNSWIYHAMTDEQIRRVQAAKLGDDERSFLRHFDEHAPWVWKDPRFCYTLRAWWPLLDPATTGVLLIERDPRATYESFVRAGWRKGSRQDEVELAARTAAHIASAKRTIADLGIPALMMRYEDFRDAPESTATRIGDFFGFELRADALGYEEQFDHHSVAGRVGTRIDKVATAMPPWLRTAIKRLTPHRLLKALYPERYV